MICLSLLVGGGSSFTPRKPLNIAIRECMYFKDGEVPVRPIAVVGWLLINDQLLRLCYSIDWSAAKRKNRGGGWGREREKEKKTLLATEKRDLSDPESNLDTTVKDAYPEILLDYGQQCIVNRSVSVKNTPWLYLFHSLMVQVLLNAKKRERKEWRVY